jgi:hypothetical protein
VNDSGTRPWPFSHYIELAALPTTPYWARALTRDALRTWRLDPFIETTELLVNELVANAVKVSGVDPVRGTYPRLAQTKLIAMRLLASGRNVVAEVWDSNPNFPQPKMVGLDDESGRGLLLVSRLAMRWNYYRPQSNVDVRGRRLWPAEGGKVIWFEVVI